MWLHSKDPRFKEKVNEIVDLYLNPPTGAVVLSVDEKTSIQVREGHFFHKGDKVVGRAGGTEAMLAQTVFRTEDEAKAWAKTVGEQLEAEGARPVLKALSALQPRGKKQRHEVPWRSTTSRPTLAG